MCYIIHAAQRRSKAIFSTTAKSCSATCLNEPWLRIAGQIRPLTTTTASQSALLPHEELRIKGLRKKQARSSKLKAGTSTNGELVSTHQDLKSYIDFHRARLVAYKDDPDKQDAVNRSYVHLGTRYEYLAQSELVSSLGFSLTRIGGKGDGGVDLIGTWSLPKTATGEPRGPAPRFRVFAQAKRYAPNRKPSPNLMREVEGTLRSATDTRQLRIAFKEHLIRVGDVKLLHQISNSVVSQDEDAQDDIDHAMSEDDLGSPLHDLGILVTTRPLTDGIAKAMANSRQCLMFIQVDEHPFELPDSKKAQLQEADVTPAPGTETTSVVDGHAQTSSTVRLDTPQTCIRQLAWNQAATQAGLEGYSVILKVRTAADDKSDGDDHVAVLTYKGAAVSPEPL